MNYGLIILIAILLSAFFSGMEIAFISSNKLRIELNRKHGSFSSRFVDIFIKHPGNYITTMLVGNNIALVIYGLVMAIVLEPVVSLLTPNDFTIMLLQTIISTIIILILAEFLPKTLFRINPNYALSVFSVPVFFFYIVLFPITWFITGISNFILKNFLKFEITSYNTKRIFNKIDVMHLLNEDHVHGDDEIKEQNPEIKIFQNALDFSNVRLRDCMIPRPEICSVDMDSSVIELRQKFIETGYSKIIVYKENIDNIVGYINCKELFKNPNSIEEGIMKLPFHPETMPANKLLSEFIQEKKSISVVVDEFGGTAGLVTIEDIIEEIFGEIEDEHDYVELIEKKISDHVFIFSGRLEIDYINEKYNIGIPESEDYETIAGLILYYNESIPKLNETIVIENFSIKILKLSKTRLELVRLEIID